MSKVRLPKLKEGSGFTKKFLPVNIGNIEVKINST